MHPSLGRREEGKELKLSFGNAFKNACERVSELERASLVAFFQATATASGTRETLVDHYSTIDDLLPRPLLDPSSLDRFACIGV